MESKGLVRQLEPAEASFEIWNKYGLCLIGYELQLASKESLDMDMIRKSLELVHIKVPSLGLCIKEEGENMFYYKQDPINIDFEICDSKDPIEVSLETVSKPFESKEGPLWRTKVILPPRYEEGSLFPYKYSITLGFHHSMTDGTSNMMICHQFISILNDLISKKSVSEESVGKLNDCEWISENDRIAKKVLETDSSLKEKYKKMADFVTERCSPWSKLEMTEEPTENFTRIYREVLEVEPTENFRRKCKDEEVSVNSGFAAVVESSLYKILDKRGLANKCTEIMGMHAISYRRYMKDSVKDFGMMVGVGVVQSEMPFLRQGDIWSHARKFGDDLKNYVDKKQSFYDILMFNLSDDKSKPGVNLFDKESATYDYTLSNLGDVSKVFKDDGEHVTVDEIFRTGDIHQFANCLSFLIHTFKGKLHMSFLSSAKYMSAEITEEFIKECINGLLENGSS